MEKDNVNEVYKYYETKFQGWVSCSVSTVIKAKTKRKFLHKFLVVEFRIEVMELVGQSLILIGLAHLELRLDNSMNFNITRSSSIRATNNQRCGSALIINCVVFFDIQ